MMKDMLPYPCKFNRFPTELFRQRDYFVLGGDACVSKHVLVQSSLVSDDSRHVATDIVKISPRPNEFTSAGNGVVPVNGKGI